MHVPQTLAAEIKLLSYALILENAFLWQRKEYRRINLL
jgi:hypothetical protein